MTDSLYQIKEPGQLNGIALSYGLDDRELESRHELGFFLHTTAFRPALGPTQPPIQWVRGALSLGVKWPGRKAHFHVVPMAIMRGAIPPFPNIPSWRGAQLSTETTLPFTPNYVELNPTE
jgi:hypothetical protein